MINNSNFDLYVDEGMPFLLYLTLEDVQIDSNGIETVTPIDLTVIESISAQVRVEFNDPLPLLTFDTAIVSIPEAKISLSLTAEQTQDIDNNQKIPTVHIGYYDIILNKTSGVKTKLVGGKFWLNQVVTR